MLSMSIGLSGLLVHQKLIELTGQNITNADTPGYHRQIGDLSARVVGASEGTGVEFKGISRAINNLLEEAIMRNSADVNSAGAVLDGVNQIQSYLQPGDGSLYDTLAKFFDSAESLSTQPDNITQRQQFLFAASNLTDRLNATTGNLNAMNATFLAQAKNSIEQVNDLATQIADLNQRIQTTVSLGQPANDLEDLRDQAISNLSELIDVRAVPQDLGVVNVMAAGAPIVLGNFATKVAVDVNDQNQMYVHAANSQQALDVAGGKLAGTLTLYNVTLPKVQGELNDFSNALVTSLDHVQSTGLGLNGPMTHLTSQRADPRPNMPLSAAPLDNPPQPGDLYITVTNLATGQRSMNRVAIDPATQNLPSVAAAISAIPNVQAVVDPQAGTLSILAAPGFGFDFTGNFSSGPDTQTITGTTTPTFSGNYMGPKNDTLNFKFTSTGTIGQTPNLSLEVRNGVGVLLTTLNVGQGYEAGTDLQDVLGVKVNLASGTVNNGDTFSLNVASDADTARLLPALGLNTFFVGNGAGGIHVNPDILDHPENLATGTSGQPGDGSNLARLVSLRDATVLNDGSLTFQQFLDGVLGDVGNQSQDLQNRKAALDSLAKQLDTQRQGYSGVDPNEELIKLVEFQRGYQASAHFISVINQTLDSLINLLGT